MGSKNLKAVAVRGTGKLKSLIKISLWLHLKMLIGK